MTSWNCIAGGSICTYLVVTAVFLGRKWCSMLSFWCSCPHAPPPTPSPRLPPCQASTRPTEFHPKSPLVSLVSICGLNLGHYWPNLDHLNTLKCCCLPLLNISISQFIKKIKGFVFPSVFAQAAYSTFASCVRLHHPSQMRHKHRPGSPDMKTPCLQL